jgi:molybdopterin molybdotransferase
VRLLGVAPDRQDAIAEALRAGLAADVLVVSGGVSAGDYDLVEPALLELGTTFLFTKVAVKPGAPLVFGRRGATLVFGLPGNPVSAQVTFDLFVRPALLKMQGARVVSRPRVSVELLAAVKNRSGRKSYVPAGVPIVTPPGGTVLDPFLGSGTTALAAEMEGFAWIGIEKEAEYVAIAEARLNGTQKGMAL